MLQGVRYVKNDEYDTHCSVARDGRSIVVSFRGTASYKNVVTDLNCDQVPFERLDHYTLLNLSPDDQSRYVNGLLNYDVAGHIRASHHDSRSEEIGEIRTSSYNLGEIKGKMGRPKHLNFPDQTVILLSWAAPRVGNHAFARYFNERTKKGVGLTGIRFVNECDPIPTTYSQGTSWT